MADTINGVRLAYKSYNNRTIDIITAATGDHILISDGRCQFCEEWERVFEFDTAAGEYGTIVICKKCLDNLWKTYNGKKRAKVG